MTTHRLVFPVLLCLSAVTSPPRADEGMWTLPQIAELPLETLRACGLALKPAQIYTSSGTALADAIVGVGGSSGSFVSPDGLIITNHHVARSGIQRLSTVEHNYLRDGFHARARAEELPLPGSFAYVLLSTEDVTPRVRVALDAASSPYERKLAAERVAREIVAEAETTGDLRCHVDTYNGGQSFALSTHLRIRDLRLVFAPPRGIGNFGGEIDNWMWPRHAGDFAILRAYVDPDGHAADFDSANVPYRPRNYLRVSAQGVTEGDVTMVMGFPGTTHRYECAAAIAYMLEEKYPRDLQTRRDLLDILETAAGSDSALAVRLASKISGLHNYLKKNTGIMEGFAKVDLLGRKRETERRIRQEIAASGELERRYGHLLPTFDSLYAAYAVWEEQSSVLSWLTYRCDLMRAGYTLWRRAVEKDKPDLEREAGYQDRDTLGLRQSLTHLQINFVPAVDRRIMEYFLRRIASWAPEHRPGALNDLLAGLPGPDVAGTISGYVDRLYRTTALGETDVRLEMLREDRGRLEARNDPGIALARSVAERREELRRSEKALAGALLELEPEYMEMYARTRGRPVYPDANGTLRFSYGTARGYSPRDAVHYDFQTTLRGVIEKHTGEFPFNAPAELRAACARDAAALDVPVDFISDNDITNGSSGSAVMDGRGRLVGLAFDGNYEAMTSDYFFDPELSRCLVVDVRYVLFLLEHVYDAGGLMQEMTIE